MCQPLELLRIGSASLACSTAVSTPCTLTLACKVVPHPEAEKNSKSNNYINTPEELAMLLTALLKRATNQKPQQRGTKDDLDPARFHVADVPPNLCHRITQPSSIREVEKHPQKKDPRDHSDRLPLRAPSPNVLPPHLRKVPEMLDGEKHTGGKR